MALLINSTPMALWHQVVHEATASCAIMLEEKVESYLVFLLMRYTNKPELANYIAASHFLQGKKMPPAERALVLQEVGDNCLIFAGLFPSLAEKRLVKISYFVNLGQASYQAIAKHGDDLYQLMADQFVNSMDILQSIRRYSKENPDLLPLQAYDLWNETHSKRALNTLKQYTNAIPLQADEVLDPFFNKNRF